MKDSIGSIVEILKNKDGSIICRVILNIVLVTLFFSPVLLGLILYQYTWIMKQKLGLLIVTVIFLSVILFVLLYGIISIRYVKISFKDRANGIVRNRENITAESNVIVVLLINAMITLTLVATYILRPEVIQCIPPSIITVAVVLGIILLPYIIKWIVYGVLWITTFF